MLRVSLPVLLVSVLAAQDPTVKPVEASADKTTTPLDRVLQADDDGRPALLTAFLVDCIDTRAIFAGQYDGLKPAQEQVVPLLCAWIEKPPSRGHGTVGADALSSACINALRDLCGDEAPDDVMAALRNVAANKVAPERVRHSAGFALAQFGERDHVEAALQKATAEAESKDNPTRANALTQLSDIHYNLREYADAVDAYKKLIAMLESRAVTMRNGTQTTYYNCACSLALGAQTDAAFDYLKKALDVAKAQGQLFPRRMLETDMDIQSLRADERFGQIIEEYYAPPKPKPLDGGKKDGGDGR